MIGIELVRPGTTEAAPDLAAAVLERCREGGVLVGKGGLYNNVLRIAPPLSVSFDEVDRAAEVIGRALTSL